MGAEAEALGDEAMGDVEALGEEATDDVEALNDAASSRALSQAVEASPSSVERRSARPGAGWLITLG